MYSSQCLSTDKFRYSETLWEDTPFLKYPIGKSFKKNPIPLFSH